MLSVSVIFFTFALGAWVIGLYLVGDRCRTHRGGQQPAGNSRLGGGDSRCNPG